MDSELEQCLSRQPVRMIPAEWRAEILSAAKVAQAVRPVPARPLAGRPSWFRAVRRRLAELLWPHPVAWAGLGAIWIFILGLNFSTREASPMVARQLERPSPEMIVELKKQQRMFAELMGSAEAPDADRPKVLPPKPRSERARMMAA